MNTSIEYMYRDASNYKQFNTVVFESVLSEDQKQELESYLEDGEHFVATQIGLEPLQSRMIGFPSDDDHGWHETYEIKETRNDATEKRTVVEFLKDLSKIKKWDPVKECKELGIPLDEY